MLMDWQASVVHILMRAVVGIFEAVYGLTFTTSAGRLFHTLTTLWLKKNFLVSSLDMTFVNLFSLMSSDSIMILC